jgi:hypothetical protein
MKINMEAFMSAMEEFCEGLPRCFTCSSKTSLGRKELLDFVGQALAMS